MFGLSFREFIGLKYGLQLPAQSLSEIIDRHVSLAFEITEQLEKQKLKILKLFSEYLEYGYYPYLLQFESVEEFRMTV